MEKEYNMTINRLPAKTWNWLRMNETQLEKIEVPTAGGGKGKPAGKNNNSRK